jgi:hypothetical protein
MAFDHGTQPAVEGGGGNPPVPDLVGRKDRVQQARLIPSLNSLKDYEAAARNESFTRAAEELCVTQGAVIPKALALPIIGRIAFCQHM